MVRSVLDSGRVTTHGMTLTKKWIGLAAAFFLLWTIDRGAKADDASDSTKAPDAALLHERVIQVFGASADPISLQVTLYTPSGEGPFPLAVMNHGATANLPPDRQPRYHLTFAAYYFLSRGYAVAMPMMRGYAGSEGHLSAHGCDDVATGLDAAHDIQAVIDYLKHQPYIDGSRIVVAGQSFGGWNALAVGTLKEPGIKGLVSFAGGMKASDCGHPDEALIQAAGTLGGRTSTPSIWFFGDNDSLFPPSVSRPMYERYVAAGGPAELDAYGSFGNDSHNMLGSGAALPIWVPKLDAFLGKVELPNKLVHAEYLPTPAPPPTHYAALDDAQALPYLNAKGPQGVAYYRKFLERPLPRALAIGVRGAGSAQGGFDPIALALKLCSQTSSGCRLYVVDNDIVWTRPTPVPLPTHFGKLDDEDAVPYLSTEGRTGYRKFLAMPRPRAFAIAPDGGWEAASLGEDPVAYALAKCGQLHHECRLYAVDGDIVW